VKHGGSPDQALALASAMAIYPALEKGYDAAIRKAYQQAGRAK